MSPRNPTTSHYQGLCTAIPAAKAWCLETRKMVGVNRLYTKNKTKKKWYLRVLSANEFEVWNATSKTWASRITLNHQTMTTWLQNHPVEWTKKIIKILSLLRQGKLHGAPYCRSSDPTPEPVQMWTKQPKLPTQECMMVYQHICLCWALSHWPWRKTGPGALRGWALPVGMSWWNRSQGSIPRRSHEEVKDEIHSFRKDLTCWDGISNETSHIKSFALLHHPSDSIRPCWSVVETTHPSRSACRSAVASSWAEGRVQEDKKIVTTLRQKRKKTSFEFPFDRKPKVFHLQIPCYKPTELQAMVTWYPNPGFRHAQQDVAGILDSEEHTKQTAYCLTAKQSWKQQSWSSNGIHGIHGILAHPEDNFPCNCAGWTRSAKLPGWRQTSGKIRLYHQ